jgi:mannitol 2-dehydrogenase
MADTLVPLAQKQSVDPLAFIGNRAVFGDLVDNRRFVASFRTTLDSLHSVGARKTLEEVRGL